MSSLCGMAKKNTKTILDDMMKVSRNRLGNVGNGYQGHFKKVLCVCSAGVLRSPTLAEILSREPFNYNTRAVGVDQEFALMPVDLVHIAWADQIVVMDNYQLEVILKMQEELEEMSRGMVYYDKCPVANFNVPDDYGFRDPALVRILTEKCYEVFGAEEE